MAIITEEPDPPTPSPPESTTSTESATSPPHKHTSQNPFSFWFYFTLSASLVALLFLSLSSLSHHDPKSWFLSLPDGLRRHYAAGRTIKVQTAPNQPPIEVFTIQEGSPKSENVLFVHGLGCSSYAFRHVVKSLGLKGLRAVAIDLPGSGFSDKSVVVVEEGPVGVLGRLWEIYSDIKEKGLFWGFDELVEKGYVNYEENEIRVQRREAVKAIEVGPEEMGRVLGQVVDAMGLAPVNLVLHDSALGLAANWVSENLGLVKSVAVLDARSSASALPLWVLQIPVVRELVVGFRFVFVRVLEFCCSKSIGGLDAEAHRILLKGRDGRRAVLGMGKKMNYSFDLVEWGNSEGVSGLPMQVIWSSGWSKEWTEEGQKVTNALPKASFVMHSGGRWPQDNAADDLAKSIFQFLSTLPKSVRERDEEPIPEHIHEMLNKAEGNNHHHHHGHGSHEHDHAHAAGFMNAYGLDHGWAS